MGCQSYERKAQFSEQIKRTRFSRSKSLKVTSQFPDKGSITQYHQQGKNQSYDHQMEFEDRKVHLLYFERQYRTKMDERDLKSRKVCRCRKRSNKVDGLPWWVKVFGDWEFLGNDFWVWNHRVAIDSWQLTDWHFERTRIMLCQKYFDENPTKTW